MKIILPIIVVTCFLSNWKKSALSKSQDTVLLIVCGILVFNVVA
jgi:hypothetical protein